MSAAAAGGKMGVKAEIRSLTGLRGVAALVVMAYHYRNLGLTAPRAHSPLGPGYLMVDLFFILSGFVMARTYAAAFEGGFDWRAYRSFLQARFARVYPLYAVATLAVFVLVWLLAVSYPSRPAQALMTNLLLVQNIGSGLLCATCSEKLVLPGWSISTEAAAYLLFPALATLALFRSRKVAIAIVLTCGLMLLVLSLLPFEWLHAREQRGPLDISGGETLWPLVRCLAGFCIGLVLWRASAAFSALTEGADLRLDILLFGSAAVLWFVPGSDALLVLLFAVLILHLCSDRSALARALGWSWPYRAGVWSYAIYLLHWPALMLLPLAHHPLRDAHVPHAWTAALCLVAVATVGLAALAHSVIERPARRELRALFSRRAVSITAEPSAP